MVGTREIRGGEQSHCRPGLKRIERLCLGDARYATVGVSNQEGMFVACRAQVVFRLVQSAGERPMNVGIDQAVVGARRSVRIMAEITSQQHRNGSKKMIGVLRL